MSTPAEGLAALRAAAADGRLDALCGRHGLRLLTAPLLQERALVGCVPLFESADGAYADAQIAAIGQRIETDHLRRLDLGLLAAEERAAEET